MKKCVIFCIGCFTCFWQQKHTTMKNIKNMFLNFKNIKNNVFHIYDLNLITASIDSDTVHRLLWNKRPIHNLKPPRLDDWLQHLAIWRRLLFRAIDRYGSMCDFLAWLISNSRRWTLRKCLARIMHLAAPVGEKGEFSDQYGPTQFRG